MEFEEFVAARGQALMRLAYVLVEERALAEDLTQTALMNTYRRWNTVQDPYAYARRAIANGMVDHHRRRRRRPEWLMPPADISSAFEARGAVPAESDSREDDPIHELLRRLPPRQKAVLVLRYYEDLEDRVIAEMLGIGLSAVRSTAARAMSTLRSSLAEAGRLQ